MGNAHFLSVAIDKAFQVFDCEKLTVSIVSPRLSKKILAITSKQETTFTAVGPDIIVWDRVTERGTLAGHRAPIIQLLLMGNVLISLSEDQTLRVWDTLNMKCIAKIDFPPNFIPTVMAHPPTYLNKILIASADGRLALWNFASQKCIYTFSFPAAISCLEASPAMDVVAVGLANGQILLHHLKFDKTLMSFCCKNSGRISALSFRTDAQPFLISGTRGGDIHVWNLSSQELVSSITASSAHDGQAIVSLECLPNEPVFISAGLDNALRMWIFDHPDGVTCRVLKSREGHREPPTTIQYYGNDTLAQVTDGTACQILSAGLDHQFRVFHTAREQQSRVMSQKSKSKSKSKYLPTTPMLRFSAMETRAKDWANVVSCHEDDARAYVWHFDHRVLGKHTLVTSSPVTSVCVSYCGHFALLGNTLGEIYKFNLQSGLPRGVFPLRASSSVEEGVVKSGRLTLKGYSASAGSSSTRTSSHQDQPHTGSVTGVVLDALNRTLISSSLDRTLKFWDFHTHALLATVQVGSAVSHMALHRDANFILVCCDDQIVRVYDIPTRRLVRRFAGHNHRITDAVFSPDARWIYSSAADNSVRVWDLPTGRCVDWLTFPKAVTSLSVSGSGEFIATTHVDQVGIYLWANKAYFSNVFLDAEPTQAIAVGFPAPKSEACGNSGTAPSSSSLKHSHDPETQAQALDSQSSSDMILSSPDQNLVTFSETPRAYWQTLFHLELIKARNKPTEAPKTPKAAPFFLPTIQAHQPMTKKAKYETDDLNNKPMEETEGFTSHWNDDDDPAGDDDMKMEDGNQEEEEEEEAPLASRILPSGATKLMSSSSTISSGAEHCDLARALHAIAKVKQHVGSVSSSVSMVAKHVSKYAPVNDLLQSLSASAVDVQLQSLCLGDWDRPGKHNLVLTTEYLLEEIESRRNFQVVQAYLNRFLKLHGEILVMEIPTEQMDRLYRAQRQAWQHLQSLLHNNLCLIQYFSQLQM